MDIPVPKYVLIRIDYSWRSSFSHIAGIVGKFCMILWSRKVVYILLSEALFNTILSDYNIISAISSMFSPICGHVTLANGGTRAQFGDASFHPGCSVVRCPHCHQPIPTATITTLQATSSTQIDPRILYNHPIASTSMGSAHAPANIDANPEGPFGDFKGASFQNALLTAQKGGRSSHITVGSGRPFASSSKQNPGSQNRRGKKVLNPGPSTENPEPIPPPPPIRKYNLKLIMSHVDTPFKLEAVPDTEEWCPREEDIQQGINGIYLTSCFGHILQQTGLWDSLPTVKPDCMYTSLKFVYI
jgi:hypothetical protein